MNTTFVEGFMPIVVGGLAFVFARPIAQALAAHSAGLGNLFRKRRIGGTFAAPLDAELSFQNHLRFLRLVAAIITFSGVSILLLD